MTVVIILQLLILRTNKNSEWLSAEELLFFF